MAFEIIPFKRQETKTIIPVTLAPQIAGGKGYIFKSQNIVKIKSIIPDESKIILFDPWSEINIDEIITITNTINGDFDGDFTVVAKNSTSEELMLNFWKYTTGGNIIQADTYAFCTQGERIIETSISPGNFVLDGDHTLEYNSGDTITIIGSGQNDGDYTISSAPTLEASDVQHQLKKWLEENIYACDTHIHTTMTNNILSEKRGGDFYHSPGTDKSGQEVVGLYTPLTNFPVMPATSTYYSFYDGRVRCIFNSLHTPERGMVSRFANYFAVVGIPSLIIEEIFHPSDWAQTLLMNGLLTRSMIRYNKFKYGDNWPELGVECSEFKRKFLSDQRLIHIYNKTLFNAHFTGRNSFSTDQNIRCLVHMEGGHQFDMDLYRLDPSFAIDNQNHPNHNNGNSNSMWGSATEPLHEWYGGFHKIDHIQKCKDRLMLLMIEPDSSQYEDLPAEQKRYAIGLLGWTPMHAYWNGMGAHGKMIHDEAIAKATMPRPEKYMKKHVYTLNESGEPYNDRGFMFDKNTRLTELGRQMVKTAFINGLVIDLKHFHRNTRDQILKMAQRGFDYDPVYSIYGDPELHTNDTYKENGELLPVDSAGGSGFDPATRNNCEIPNPNSKNNLPNNKYQVMVTHAALAFVDENGTNVKNIKKIINDAVNNNQDIGLDLSDIECLQSYEDELKEKIFPDVSIITDFSITYDIDNNPVDYIQPDNPDEIKNKIIFVIDNKQGLQSPTEKLKAYLNYFLPLYLRGCHNIDNLNLDNNEIAKIINLGGVVGIISEDRVSRTNEHMFGNGKRRKKNKAKKDFINGIAVYDESKLPYNTNTWPMYGDDITKLDDDGNNYLYGEPFSFEKFNDPTNKARIPLEDQVAFGQGGLFHEIQALLDEIHNTYNSRNYGSLYHNRFKLFNHINKKLFDSKTVLKFKNNNTNRPNINIQAVAGLEALYRSIDQVARVAREKVYKNPDGQPTHPDQLQQGDSLQEIIRKLKLYYENICISSDFDGITDPIDLFSSPRMLPVAALYIANRLKWDLYRRYYGKDLNPAYGDPNDGNIIIRNKDIGHERGQTLNVDDGIFNYNSEFKTGGLNNLQDGEITSEQREEFLNETVKEIMKQILDTNFINMVAKAQGWIS